MSSNSYNGKAIADKNLNNITGGGTFTYERDPKTGRIKTSAEFESEEDLEQFRKLFRSKHPGPHGHPHGGHPRKPVSPKASSVPVEDINKI